MQTIARANRVFRDKQNGLIVDYIGIFEQLEKALSLYATSDVDKKRDMPLKVKELLVVRLEEEITDAKKFCLERGIDLDEIHASSGFERGRLIRDAANEILKDVDDKRVFLSLESSISLLFRAIRPHDREEEFRPIRKLIVIIARRIRTLSEPEDISHVLDQIDDLLDRSVAAEPYIMPEDPIEQLTTNLSEIDFDLLLKLFKKGRKWSYVQRLQSILRMRAAELVILNKSRKDLAEKLRILIDKYNEGAINVDQHFQELLQFTRAMKEEEQRHIAEKLTEEELALFDILTQPEPKLDKSDRELVKTIAKDLLRILKTEKKLVIDWKKNQGTQAKVEVAIKDALYELLPDSYSQALLDKKCELVYQHVYEAYHGEGQSVYS